MSFTRPTLAEIDTRCRADLEANIDAISLVRQNSVEAGIARAEAGASHELHGHLDWNYQQLFPDTAATESLVRQAGFYGLTRRAGATAKGTVRLTGDDGTAIPSGTRLGSQTGIELTTSGAAVIADGIALVPVNAVLAGVAGNLAVAKTVTILAPIVGVSSNGTVEAPGLSAGADEERDDQLLDRLLFRMSRPGHGGASSDYVRWALEVPGIAQAWPSGGEMGLGTVTLRVAVGDALHGPIPTAAEVEAVRAYIEARASASDELEGRPVTAQLFVVPPIAAPVDVTVRIAPDTDTTRAGVIAELEALFRATAAPGGIVPRDAISQAISLAPSLLGWTAPTASRCARVRS